MSEERTFSRSTGNICWDCKFAIGGCSWSDELIPVKGWTANKVVKQTTETFNVIGCPLFVRDAFDFGQHKLHKGDK